MFPSQEPMCSYHPSPHILYHLCHGSLAQYPWVTTAFIRIVPWEVFWLAGASIPTSTCVAELAIRRKGAPTCTAFSLTMFFFPFSSTPLLLYPPFIRLPTPSQSFPYPLLQPLLNLHHPPPFILLFSPVFPVVCLLRLVKSLYTLCRAGQLGPIPSPCTLQAAALTLGYCPKSSPF